MYIELPCRSPTLIIYNFPDCGYNSFVSGELSHESVDTVTATKEIERYMTNPGQALSYMAGSITIQKLRDKYSRQQGNNFSLRKFHEALLREGDMPLSVLEKYMDERAATIQ